MNDKAMKAVRKAITKHIADTDPEDMLNIIARNLAVVILTLEQDKEHRLIIESRVSAYMREFIKEVNKTE